MKRKRYTRWTDEMDAELIRRYPTESARAIAVDFDLPYTTVRSRARTLQQKGLIDRKKARSVRHQDDELRRLHAQGMKWSEIAERLGRSPATLRNQARLLGLPSRVPNRRLWTDNEVDFLFDHYSTMTASEIGKHLNRTRDQVMLKVRHHGLRKSGMSLEGQHLLWEMRDTDGVVEFMARHFNREPDQIRVVLERLREAGGPAPLPPVDLP